MEARRLACSVFLLSGALVLYELVLTRTFSIVLFAQFAHLAISLALLGISAGAVALHLWPGLVPEDRLGERLRWLCLASALGMVVAVLLAVRLPLTRDSGAPRLIEFLARQKVAADLVQTRVLVVLLPALAFPFACVGAAFAAAFRSARSGIGLVYAADLSGGAAGCLLFLPLLALLRGPDSVSVAALAACVAAVIAPGRAGDRAGPAVAVGCALAAVGLVVVGLGTPLFRIRHAAGFDERFVVEEHWTPLARVAVVEGRGTAFISLDNASRSEVFVDPARARIWARELCSFVFRLHRPPARIAVLAAGAGPEMVEAQALGYRDFTALEIAPEVFRIMRHRYAHLAGNPYMPAGVRTLNADARSGVRQDPRPFDIIELSQANFYTAGGVLSQTWNASLLVTREAFHDYLGHLTPDGTISMFGSVAVTRWARGAAAALVQRGARHPWRHIALVRSSSHRRRAVLLVKARPFRRDELDRLRQIARQEGDTILLDPGKRSAWRARVARGRILTDDRPYWDTPASILRAARGLLRSSEKQVDAAELLLRVLIVQLLVVLLAGAILLVGPLLWRGRGAMGRVEGAGAILGYFGCIGYGYLAVEVVLIHELVLFVGHPTYAVTLVIFTLLVSSGLGSFLAGRVPSSRLGRAHAGGLTLTVALACVHAFALAPLFTRHLLGQSLAVRVLLVGISLAPLGLVMGTAFPLALRRLPERAQGLVPWCWALNGWTSVFSALVTIFAARLCGYRIALCLALGAYLLALVLARRLRRLTD